MKTTDLSGINYMALPGLLPGTPFVGDKKTPDNIISLVAEAFNVTVEQMKSKHRYRTFVMARQTAIYLIRMHTSKSLREAGLMFGGRDHTTSIHSIRTVRNLLQTDETFRDLLLNLENKL